MTPEMLKADLVSATIFQDLLIKQAANCLLNTVLERVMRKLLTTRSRWRWRLTDKIEEIGFADD